MMRLRELRQARKINQLRLAVDLNLTQAAISKYELGKSEPGYDLLCRIADYFDVTVDYLIGHSETKHYYLSQNEQKLLDIYKRFDRIQRDKLEGYMENLLYASNTNP